MKWKRLKPITDLRGGCLNCPLPQELAMKFRISVGCGLAVLKKDGQIVWAENFGCKTQRDLLTVRRAETMAAKDSDHDWRIVLDSPIRSRTYQRQDIRRWVLVKKGLGFA